MKAIYWVIGVALFGIGLFIFILVGDSQKFVPKIKLSYFKDEQEISEAVVKRLSQEISKESYFWVGVEPEKNEQLEVALQLKKQLEQVQAFSVVLIDQELNLSPLWLQKFKPTEVVSIKQNIAQVADKLFEYESKKQNYFLLTASIYTTPIIKQNQIHQIKLLKAIRPTTFSYAFFPITVEDEAKMLFRCLTEDHSGTSDWGCAVVNKARFIRRKINNKNNKDWVGLMDLIGEKDYMLLINKK